MDHLSGTYAYSAAARTPTRRRRTGGAQPDSRQDHRDSGPLVTAHGAPSPTSLDLSDIAGTVCGGRLAGKLAVTSFDPLEYDGALDLAYVTSRAWRAALGAGKHAPSGWLRGSAPLPRQRPTASRALDLTGKGKADRGHLYDLPLIMTAWNLVHLELPGKNALTDARVEFRIRDELPPPRPRPRHGPVAAHEHQGHDRARPGRGLRGIRESTCSSPSRKRRESSTTSPSSDGSKSRATTASPASSFRSTATGTVDRPEVILLPKLLINPINEFWDHLTPPPRKPPPQAG